MERFTLRRQYRGRRITALIVRTDGGVQVTLTGGDLPHIGAIGVADPGGKCAVTQFPAHREGIVCETWVQALAAAGHLPAVVAAGIHYDGLDPAGIRRVLALTDGLLAEALRRLG